MLQHTQLNKKKTHILTHIYNTMDAISYDNYHLMYAMQYFLFL